MLTQQLSDDNLPAYRRVSGETVLPDIRVIAIDQALMQGAMGEEPEGNRQVRTVTLEVTPKQAERVAVATRLGRLALVVRSASGAEAPAEAGHHHLGRRRLAGAPRRARRRRGPTPDPADLPGRRKTRGVPLLMRIAGLLALLLPALAAAQEAPPPAPPRRRCGS